MALKLPSAIRPSVYSASSVASGVITGFFAYSKWTVFYKMLPLRYLNIPLSLILMPISLSLNIFLLILAGIEIFNGGNMIKNIGNLFVELGKVIQSTFSLSSLMITIPWAAFLLPVLLLTATAIEGLFNGGNCIVQAWHWHQAIDAKNIYEHKMLTAKFGVNLIVNVLLCVGLGLMFLSGIGPITLLPIGLLTAAATLIGGLVSVGFGYYVDQKIAAKQMQIEPPIENASFLRSSTGHISLHLAPENKRLKKDSPGPSANLEKIQISSKNNDKEEHPPPASRNVFH